MFKKPKSTKISLSLCLVATLLFLLFISVLSRKESKNSSLTEEIKTQQKNLKNLELELDYMKAINENYERTISSFKESNFNEAITTSGKPIDLAIIVPYRGWTEHRNIFTNFMSSYLKEYGFNAVIVIVEQVDNRFFNRGSLLNAGVLEVTKLIPDLKFFILHDIDRLPMGFVDYSYGKLLGMVEELYPQYAGGVLKIDREIFEGINGFSNCFWGWGEEDDNLYMRLHDSQYGKELLENDVRIPRMNYSYFHVYHEKQSREKLKESRKFHHYVYSNRLKEGLDPSYSFEGLSTIQYHITDQKYDFPSLELKVELPGPTQDECFERYEKIIEKRVLNQKSSLWENLRPSYGKAPFRHD